MSAKLNQIIAVEKGLKNRVNEKLTAIYKTFQKGDLFVGFHKKYTPRDEDPSSQFGEKLPDNIKNVQADAKKLLADIAEAQTELLDVSYLRDTANTLAKADVVVDGAVIIKDAPVPYLLWLEKQLNDLHSEVKKIPTLDPADKWKYDSNQGMYATEPFDTASTKKVTVPLVLYAATKEHPAQVKEVVEDVRAGTWTTTKYSTALPVDRKELLLARVEKLQRAVKQAREAANTIEVPTVESVGQKVFNFVLAE